MQTPHPAFVLLDHQGVPGKPAAWHLRHRLGAEVVLDGLPEAAPFFALSLPTAPPDDSGVTHVLEHMIFRGARAAPVSDLYAQMMLAGPVSDLNASTLADRTTFHATSASEAGRNEALEILAEAIFDPLLDGADFAEERAVVWNEMTGHWSDPARVALESLRAGLFPGTAQVRAYGGLPNEIAGLTLAQVQDFHRRVYRNGAARLYLTLQGDPVPVLRQLDHLFRRPAASAALAPILPNKTPFAAPIRLAPHLVQPALGWRLPGIASGLAELVLRSLVGAEGAFAQRGLPVPLRLSQASEDAADPDLRLVFPATAAAEAARFWRELDGELPALVDVVAGIAPRSVAAMATDAVDPSGQARHARIVGPWHHGTAPLPLLDGAGAFDRLCAMTDNRTALRTTLVAQLQTPSHRVVATLLPSEHVRVQSPARPSAHRTSPCTLTFHSPSPSLQPRGQDPSGITRRLLSLPLNGLSAEDLPLAALLLRHLAESRGLDLTYLAGPAHTAAVLTAATTARHSVALDARFADLFTAALPDQTVLTRLATGLTQRPPLHLLAAMRVEAAFSAGAAMLERLQGLSACDAFAAAPPDAARLATLCAALSRGAGPTPKASPQPAHGCLDMRPEIHLVPGRLHTLGLGVSVPTSPLLHLAAHALEWLWLRDTVRVQGGAYGVRCRVAQTGVLVFLSARDPQSAATFRHFEASADWLANHLNGETLSRAIRGTLEHLARPLSPGEAMIEDLRQGLFGAADRAATLRMIQDADETAIRSLAGQIRSAMAHAKRVEFRGVDS